MQPPLRIDAYSDEAQNIMQNLQRHLDFTPGDRKAEVENCHTLIISVNDHPVAEAPILRIEHHADFTRVHFHTPKIYFHI